MKLTIEVDPGADRADVTFNEDHQASVSFLYGDPVFFYVRHDGGWLDIPQWDAIEVIDDMEAGAIILVVGHLFSIALTADGYNICDEHGNMLEGADFTPEGQLRYTHTL